MLDADTKAPAQRSAELSSSVVPSVSGDGNPRQVPVSTSHSDLVYAELEKALPDGFRDLLALIVEYQNPLTLQQEYADAQPFAKDLPLGHPVLWDFKAGGGLRRAIYLGQSGFNDFNLLIRKGTDPHSWSVFRSRHYLDESLIRWTPTRGLEPGTDPLRCASGRFGSRDVGKAFILRIVHDNTSYYVEAVVESSRNGKSFTPRYSLPFAPTHKVWTRGVWRHPLHVFADGSQISASLRLIGSDHKHGTREGVTSFERESSAPRPSTTNHSTSFGSTATSGTTRPASLRTSGSSPSSTTSTSSTRALRPGQVDDKGRPAPLHTSQDVSGGEQLLPTDGPSRPHGVAVSVSNLETLNHTLTSTTDLRVQLGSLYVRREIDHKGPDALPEDLPDPVRFHPSSESSGEGDDGEGFVHLSIAADADSLTIATLKSVSTRSGDPSPEAEHRLHFYIKAAAPDDES